MKKIFVLAFLMFFVVMGLFSSPIVAADTPHPIAGEWVWKSKDKEITNVLSIRPSSLVENDGEFSGTLVSSSSGRGMLFDFGRGKIIDGKISFTLNSLHPDGCGGMVVSGEMVKSGEIVLLFSPLPPPSRACSSSGTPFSAVFKRAIVKNYSQGPVGGGPIN